MLQTSSASDRVGLGSPDLFVERVGSYPQTRHDPLDPITAYTGYAFQVHGGLASWTSHKQSTVSNSTMQSEYMSLSDASREAVDIAQFFQELNISSMPVLILSDSETALDLADGTTVNHSKSKHIDIKYHQVRHYIQEGKVEASHIASEYRIADIFPKALGPQKHNHLVQLMGMQNSHELQ